MGTLVAMRYPTTLFAKAADHTYVMCAGGGKAWGCWGGKTGGTELRRGAGSTKRADAIAQPNEKARITCYLVNGVCHQAANRILLPAAITVNGARGYHLSQALYGVYGRPGMWPCSAPFNQHPTITGDLQECAEPVPTASEQEPVPESELFDWHYTRGALEIYERYADVLAVTPEAPVAPSETREEFQLTPFEHMLDSRLGPMVDVERRDRLLEVRRDTEQKHQAVERDYASERVPGPVIVEAMNRLTIEFQQQIGEHTTDAEYETLLELSKKEQIVLADPQATAEAFGEQ